MLLAVTSSLHAQRFNKKQEYDGLRDGTWEASLLIGSQGSLDFAGDNGSSLKIDSELAWGFTAGWNWTPRLNFSYTAIFVPEDPELPTGMVDYSADRYSSQLNATYHFFKGPITPYVQAGLGWAKLDSNVPSQPPTTGCWWDPWWGYICFTDWQTYEATGLSYNVGVGLRWDVNGALFVKGAYNREFFSADRADFDFDTLTLEAGLMW